MHFIQISKAVAGPFSVEHATVEQRHSERVDLNFNLAEATFQKLLNQFPPISLHTAPCVVLLNSPYLLCEFAQNYLTHFLVNSLASCKKSVKVETPRAETPIKTESVIEDEVPVTTPITPPSPSATATTPCSGGGAPKSTPTTATVKPTSGPSSKRFKMAENCSKCKKVITSKETGINCSCQKKFHRSCVNIDDTLFEAIQKNPMIVFSCDDCRQQSPKAMAAKLQALDEKLNKVSNGVNQIQGRMYQQYFQFGNANNQGDAKKQTNNLIVVGNNCNSDRLQVVCDYGRWVQVGKFATSTSEEDIIEHLAQELKINKNLVKCTKLVKNDANLAALSYCKFKISIPDYRFNELFNEAIWPSVRLDRGGSREGGGGALESVTRRRRKKRKERKSPKLEQSEPIVKTSEKSTSTEHEQENESCSEIKEEETKNCSMSRENDLEDDLVMPTKMGEEEQEQYQEPEEEEEQTHTDEETENEQTAYE
uniref:PHD-type domain-containing protein n=1 Tax=Glossina brevipalpis TaxID=37001 RepID=A0A1A9W7H1_9MUSC